jgi:outer membrane lipoprotein LolB
MIRVRVLAAIAMAMLCAGCASLAPVDVPPPAASFDVLGRVLAGGDGRAFSSNLRWRHDAGEHEIWLMSPVGQTLAHIAADAAGATLTAADQQVYRAGTVEALTESAFGWALPLTHLQHWIQGRVAPDGIIATVSRDTHGRLAALGQDGWMIRFVYADAAGDMQRPRRLDMIRDGRQIRLVIDDWRVGETR